MKVAMMSYNSTTARWEVAHEGKILETSANKHYLKSKVKNGKCPQAVALGITDVVEVAAEVLREELEASVRFDINERFDFLTDFVLMVEDGTSPSLLVSGEGGLGKTYTVNEALQNAGRRVLDLGLLEAGAVIDPKRFYTVIKGYSTAKGLYQALYDNRDKIIVFDDCDSVLKDPVALNLLKAALDSYDRRVISWNTTKGDNLPPSFEFKGGVIFISNMPLHKIDQAVRSRAIVIDLSMTTQQKIDRMEVLVQSPKFLPEYSDALKRTALNFLESIQERASELSLRTLIQVVKVASRGGDWKRRAEYLLTAV